MQLLIRKTAGFLLILFMIEYIVSKENSVR